MIEPRWTDTLYIRNEDGSVRRIVHTNDRTYRFHFKDGSQIDVDGCAFWIDAITRLARERRCTPLSVIDSLCEPEGWEEVTDVS